MIPSLETLTFKSKKNRKEEKDLIMRNISNLNRRNGK